MKLWTLIVFMLAVTVLVVAFAAPAHATTGFLQDDYVEGNMRYCVYDVLGDDYIITVPSWKMCPLTIKV